MLNIKNLDNVSCRQIRELVTEFRRFQVSRFPIDVIPNDAGYAVGFIDSRFPTDRWNASNMLAMLYLKDNGETPTLTLESRLIENDKYATYNDDYHTKSTKDMKKMLKFMKEYVKPFTAHEIANKTRKTARDKLENWQSEPDKDLRSFRYHVGDGEILDTFNKLRELGVAPVNNLMEKLYESTLPAYIEGKERAKKNFDNYCHVFINPDESLMISKVGIDAGRTVAETFNSLEDMPTEVQQNLAMLRMLEAGSFAPNLGIKLTDKEFWIEGYPLEPNA